MVAGSLRVFPELCFELVVLETHRQVQLCLSEEQQCRNVRVIARGWMSAMLEYGVRFLLHCIDKYV